MHRPREFQPPRKNSHVLEDAFFRLLQSFLDALCRKEFRLKSRSTFVAIAASPFASGEVKAVLRSLREPRSGLLSPKKKPLRLPTKGQGSIDLGRLNVTSIKFCGLKADLKRRYAFVELRRDQPEYRAHPLPGCLIYANGKARFASKNSSRAYIKKERLFPRPF